MLRKRSLIDHVFHISRRHNRKKQQITAKLGDVLVIENAYFIWCALMKGRANAFCIKNTAK